MLSFLPQILHHTLVRNEDNVSQVPVQRIRYVLLQQAMLLYAGYMLLAVCRPQGLKPPVYTSVYDLKVLFITSAYTGYMLP